MECVNGLCYITEKKWLCLYTEPPNSYYVIPGCALRAQPADTELKLN
jgi:hypothetical protein